MSDQTKAINAAIAAAAALTAVTGTARADDGLELARTSQCLVCHSIDKKMVGPPWKDVATRYNEQIKSGKTTRAAVVEQLVDKVAKGGKGNWNEETGGAAMKANYPRVSRENIRKLVEYILALK